MKLRIAIISILFCCVFISGCNGENILLGPKREVTSYSERTFNLDKPLDLKMVSDSGNIEIYNWDKKKVKFEITKRVKGNQKDLPELLDNFKITINQEGCNVVFTSEYNGKMKNPADRGVDLKVYIPKKIELISCELDLGTIKFLDDMKCNIDVDVKTANIDINRLVGAVNITGDMGNLRIQDGIIKGESTVNVNFGNIYIKGELEQGKKYDFKTGAGNIDLELPEDTQLDLECVGNLAVNEFSTGLYDTQLNLKSDMGRISIKKF